MADRPAIDWVNQAMVQSNALLSEIGVPPTEEITRLLDAFCSEELFANDASGIGYLTSIGPITGVWDAASVTSTGKLSAHMAVGVDDVHKSLIGGSRSSNPHRQEQELEACIRALDRENFSLDNTRRRLVAHLVLSTASQGPAGQKMNEKSEKAGFGTRDLLLRAYSERWAKFVCQDFLSKRSSTDNSDSAGAQELAPALSRAFIGAMPQMRNNTGGTATLSHAISRLRKADRTSVVNGLLKGMKHGGASELDTRAVQMAADSTTV